MSSPKVPKPPPPPLTPPPVSATGPEKAQADLDQRRREKGRYSFDKTILSPLGGGKTTLG